LKGTVQEDRSSADNQESSPEAEKKTQEKETSSKEETPSGDKKSTSSKEDVPRIRSAENAEGSSDTGVADVAEKVMPAIVSVYNKYTQEAQFFGRQYTQEGQSTGSGIIIGQTDEELLIVTNNHVVEGADSLSVQFINEENCEALLKGTDAGSDLAVISVPLANLNAETTEAIAIAELGSSDDLRIGEPAIAIGNALGYGQSLTVGYISALNREITAEDGITGTFIQTDAAINPGNSGGALLNSAGQVIGINSNKIGGSAIEGMGFAIPISKAIPIIEELKVQESKTRVSEEEQGALGILGITVTSDVASAYGLPVGAYVEEIIEGSAAQQSDLSQGDIITGINGQTINGMEALQEQLSFYKAGEEVTLTVQHPMEGGSYKEREITLTLSKRSDIQSSDSQDSGNQNRRQQEIPYEEEGGEDLFDMFPFGSFGF
ncbi:MAG: trypsin-like peptidase domain-containing protein, partial [Lachnospiraceae bacterium]|nr:trypsin-like peptidase domain-containing protein [Lachnospiraceae bacterium]